MSTRRKRIMILGARFAGLELGWTVARKLRDTPRSRSLPGHGGARRMLEQGRPGVIINISSINGHTIAIDGGSLTRGYPARLTGLKGHNA